MEETSGRTHRILTELRQGRGFLKLPLVVKADQESFLKNGLLLEREGGKGAFTNAHEILEVNLAESKLTGADFALVLTDLEDSDGWTVTPIVLPRTDRDDFALALENKIQAWHLNADTSCARQKPVIEVLVDCLCLRGLLFIEILENRIHATEGLQ